MADKRFNPISTSQAVESSYRDYLTTTIHFEDKNLQKQLQEILKQRNYLSKGPFLEATPPYVKGATLRQLVTEGVLCESMLTLGGFDADQRLYAHQAKAIMKAKEGKNYIVATGTGSGKTECFLLPIINDILEEFSDSGPQPGVRAMILYPMNALANDQLKRLRTLLDGTDITFGRYTGDTKETEYDARLAWKEENPDETPSRNELISREQIRRHPPNILLTNYSMLEYLLLRPQDAPLFQSAFGSNWRHIAIDEAHVYTGALGTEIAYLLRRLKARIRNDAGVEPTLHCYATSATIGSPDDMPKVAKFAQDIFGEPFEQGPDTPSVIKSSQDSPTSDLRDIPWGRLPLETWVELRKTIAHYPDGSGIRSVIEGVIPDAELSLFDDAANPKIGLGLVLLGEASTAGLVESTKNGPINLGDIGVIEEVGIDELNNNNDGVELITSMAEVLSFAERTNNIPVLSSRYHFFLRAPEGMYINLANDTLIPEKTIGVSFDEENYIPVYEVSVCRHCGQAYILGTEDNETYCAWLNPQHVGTNADDDFLPRDYYRIAKNGCIENFEEDDEKVDDGRRIEWLCPVCGSLHDKKRRRSAPI